MGEELIPDERQGRGDPRSQPGITTSEERDGLTTGAGGQGFCASRARQKFDARHNLCHKRGSRKNDLTAAPVPARAGTGGKHSPRADAEACNHLLTSWFVTSMDEGGKLVNNWIRIKKV